MVSSESWKKSVSFESLRNSVYTLVGAHSVANLVLLISSDLPHDTGAAFQEATLAMQDIVNNSIELSNLDPVAFLTHTGKEAYIADPADFSARSEDITFLRINCTVDSAINDNRITTFNPFSFQFCLRLPQYSHDINK